MFRVVYQGIPVEMDAIGDVIALMGALAPRTPAQQTVTMAWPVPGAALSQTPVELAKVPEPAASPAAPSGPPVKFGQRVGTCSRCAKAFPYTKPGPLPKHCQECREAGPKDGEKKATAFDDEVPLGKVSVMKPTKQGSAR